MTVQPQADAVAPGRGAEWNTRPVPVFAGTFDTHIKTGEDYNTVTLADIFAQEPDNKAKGPGLAFIPSSYANFDAREHAAQRERGEYVALVGDVDSGNHSPAEIKRAVKAFAGPAVYLIYSSAHARPGDMRWRIILPLAAQQTFDAWYDAQCAFFAFMEARGVDMDHAMARAAQPVYLPNVPPVHAKTGTPLRGEDGAPLHYKRTATPLTAPGLNLDAPPVAEGITTIRQRRAEDERQRETIRREVEARRAAKPRGDGASVIDDFNANNPVATMLEICGYTQSPRSSEDWRSPNQTGETYATRIIGSKWISLSASDAAARVGESCKSGCFGDAYDLYSHYKHGGDHKAAYRALIAEHRGNNNVIYPAQFEPLEPPVWMAEIPAHDEPPEWGGDGLPQAGDVMDWQGTADDLRKLTATVMADKLHVPALKRGISAAALMAKQFAPINFVVPGLLAEGATLFGGKPKIGKSWMAYDFALAIASGRPVFGSIPITQGDVLYLALEDSERRLKSRLLKKGIRDAPERLTLVTEWPSLDNGCIAEMEAWADSVERPSLAIVDVLKMVRGATRGNESIYDADYRALSGLATFARNRGIAVLIVHHTRKMEADDPLESLSGTNGLTGAEDTVMVLKRDNGTLGTHGTGGVSSRELDLFDPRGWETEQ